MEPTGPKKGKEAEREAIHLESQIRQRELMRVGPVDHDKSTPQEGSLNSTLSSRRPPLPRRSAGEIWLVPTDNSLFHRDSLVNPAWLIQDQEVEDRLSVCPITSRDGCWYADMDTESRKSRCGPED